MPSGPDRTRRRMALGLAAGVGLAALALPGRAPHAESPEPYKFFEPDERSKPYKPIKLPDPRERPKLPREVMDAVLQLEHLAGRPMPALEGRVVILSFFASWCAPCIDEFAYLGSIYNAYGGEEPAIVAINLHETWAGEIYVPRLRRFIDRTKPLFTVVRGDDEIAEMFGGVREIPSLFVFDRRGRLAYHFRNQPGNEISDDTEARLHMVLSQLL